MNGRVRPGAAPRGRRQAKPRALARGGFGRAWRWRLGAGLSAALLGAGALLAVGAALVGGCGPDAGDYRLERPDAGWPDGLADLDAGPSNIIEDDPLEPWDTTDAGPLSGIFAAEFRVQASVIVELETRQLARLRLLQHGRQVRIRAQTCRLGLPSIEGIAQIGVPLSLEMLIRSKDTEAEGEHLSAEQPVGAAFTPPDMLMVLGAHLDDPLADPLPTAANPAGAFDEDEDGQVGVTLSVLSLLCPARELLFAAIRAAVHLSGTVDSLDLITGTVDPVLDQSVLGYSDPCLAAAAGLPVKIREGSTFQALRVGDELDLNENGNVTCGEIVEAAPLLFGEYWSRQAGAPR